MGKSEKFDPPYIQERERKLRESEKDRKAKEEADQRERDILEKKIESVLLDLIGTASWDLASEKYGEDAHRHEVDFQDLRRRIEKEIKDYLSKNLNIRKRLYDRAMKEKYPKLVMPKELVNIYKNTIRGGEHSTTNVEEEKFEEVVKKVLMRYLATQNLGPQRNGIIDISALERREEMAENVIRSIAMKFFKENTRPPEEEELLGLVKKSLEV